MAAIIPIRAFSDNYIWAIREGSHAVVVDPGDAAPVERWLAREGVALAGILVTHHHGDHVGGVVALSARRNIPVFGPAREDIPGRTRALAEGDAVELEHPPLRLHVVNVPGHTAGHIAYVGEIDRYPVAFVGDTLFAGGCGRLFEGTPAQMAASLARLAALPGDTHVYCAHEYTLANLRFARAVEPAARRWRRESRARNRGGSATSRRCRRRSRTSAPPIRSCALRCRRSSRRRSGTRAARWPTRWRLSRPCASGRTRSERGNRAAGRGVSHGRVRAARG